MKSAAWPRLVPSTEAFNRGDLAGHLETFDEGVEFMTEDGPWAVGLVHPGVAQNPPTAGGSCTTTGAEPSPKGLCRIARRPGNLR
jgi:hypothetical protein